MQHLLEIVGINKSFGSVQVLKTCSMTVDAKETVVVIGPSGSGKSTLLRSINLLEPVEADTSVRQVLYSVSNSDDSPQIRNVSRQILSQVPEIQ